MLKDKIVVITGGAGLLGRTFAETVVQAGGTAVVADIDERAAQDVQKQLARATPGRVESACLDITSAKSLDDVIADLSQRFGRVDALVNNAYPRNQHYGRPFFEVEYPDFCDNLSRHVGGYFLAAQRFARHFMRQGQGNIVNIASVYGVIPPRFEIYEGTEMTMPVEYAATKSAVIHLTKYMAKLFQGKNIRVNSISPGGVLNHQDPVFVRNYNKHGMSVGMLQPSDLSGTLAFLLSDASTAINGQNLIVDDGFSL